MKPWVQFPALQKLAWWCTPAILVPKGWRQEDEQKLKVILDSIVNSKFRANYDCFCHHQFIFDLDRLGFKILSEDHSPFLDSPIDL